VTATADTADMVEGRAQVMHRALGACEIESPACEHTTPDWHHRQSRRGGAHGPDNGLAACRPCHRWVHANPAAAQANGWTVSLWADPATVPALVRGHPVTLTAGGTYS